MIEPLLESSLQKLDAALAVFFASVEAYPGFDPAREYTPKESEPFDALSDRYLRAFESSLKFFRTWERVREVAPSESFRDLLLRMEKLGFITDVMEWLYLRDIRNRIAHEYLPAERARLYEAMVDRGNAAFRRLQQRACEIAD